MSLEQGFLQAILADPDDDVHRLVFADWLEERGDPRGEFIRLQIERNRPCLDEVKSAWLWVREQELLSAYEAEWVQELRPWVREWRFSRGFVEWVRIPAEYLVGGGRKVFHRTPIRSARFNEATEHVAALAELPELAALQLIDLGYNLLTAREVEPLVVSPHLRNLVSLDLACNPLADAGARALAAAPFPKLRELYLYRTQLGNEGLEALLDAHGWPGFTILNLYGNITIGRSGISSIAGSTRSATLESLDLSYTTCRDGDAQALADSSLLGNLKSLRLAGNHITDRGALALASARALGALEELDLSGNDIGEPGALGLASAPGLGGLRRLVLGPTTRLQDPRTRRALQDRYGDGLSLRWKG